ncbi:hypothetical protein [Ilumatobacter sp.]|uniref:hypothetical protein n=1 Tax=Ilumatobacter sp. TaxID=1967498 RepID=UPI003C6F096C
MTGRNHHSVASGVIQEMATGFPGSCGVIPKSCATIGDLLKHAGYTCGRWGKYHNVPDYHTSSAGPFDNWPTGQTSTTSTASSPGKPTSSSRCSTATPPPSRRRAVPRTATSSRWISPTTASPGSVSRRRSPRPSGFLVRPELPTGRISHRSTGAAATRAGSAWAGTSSAPRCTRTNSRWEPSPKEPNSPNGPSRFRPGTVSPRAPSALRPPGGELRSPGRHIDQSR